MRFLTHSCLPQLHTSSDANQDNGRSNETHSTGTMHGMPCIFFPDTQFAFSRQGKTHTHTSVQHAPLCSKELCSEQVAQTLAVPRGWIAWHAKQRNPQSLWECTIHTLKQKGKKSNERNEQTQKNMSRKKGNLNQVQKLEPRSTQLCPTQRATCPTLNAAIETAWISIVAKVIIASFVKLEKKGDCAFLCSCQHYCSGTEVLNYKQNQTELPYFS